MGPKTKSDLWVKQKELRMIDCIEAERFIWDIKDPNYHKANLKCVSFNNIAAILGDGFTGNMVKERWANIKSQFATNHKRTTRIRGSGSDKSFTPTWDLYERLTFLLPCLRKRSPDWNLSHSKPQDVDPLEDHTTYEGYQYLCRPTLEPDSVPSASSPLPSKRIHTDEDHDYSKHKQRLNPNSASDTEYSNLRGIKADANEEDGSYHFAMHVAAQLRLLSPLNSEMAKLNIQEILIKYMKEEQN